MWTGFSNGVWRRSHPIQKSTHGYSPLAEVPFDWIAVKSQSVLFVLVDVDFETLAQSTGSESFAEMPKEYEEAEKAPAKTSRKAKTEKKLLSLGETAIPPKIDFKELGRGQTA